MKKIKVNLLIGMMLGLICIFSTRTEALSPPYLCLNTSQDIITSDNAILHATLINTGVAIEGFEIFIYKDSVLVKNGFKAVDNNNGQINICFDLKKDLAIELLPDTKYTYTIYTRIEGKRADQAMYKQTFWFTTLSTKSYAQKETTVDSKKQITKCNPKVKKPGVVKIKSAKSRKNKSAVVKFVKAKNAKKYQVQYSTSRKYKKVSIKSTKKLIYTIKNLKKGETYYIRVRGVNGNKKGKWSKSKKVTIK